MNDLEARMYHQERMVRVLRDRIIELESELAQARTYAVELEDLLQSERTASAAVMNINNPDPEEPPEV